MKVKGFWMTVAILSSFLFSSCNSAINPLGSKEAPELFPISQNGKIGYINRKGEVVIQPQFQSHSIGIGFFSEGLAAACIGGKCGYIDSTGKFAINPQFELAGAFSENLAAVMIENKIGYIDKTGKFAVNPQFEKSGRGPEEWIFISSFSDNLASVKIGDKYGFIDKEGKIVINPQFESAFPFSEGLAAISMGNKWGYADKEGKIVINPQFEEAYPFRGGLAIVKVGKQYGYIDEQGKIVINPQFDAALPFSDEGLAWVIVGEKSGYIDKEGKYAINPQFNVPRGPNPWFFNQFFHNHRPKVFSFSEGLAPIMVGEKFGYIDKNGKIVINPQFASAFSFEGGVAAVFTELGLAYIDKEGKYVWRETRETPRVSNANTNIAAPSSANTEMTNTNSNTAVVVNSNGNMATPVNPNVSNSNSSPAQRSGRLVTDANLRSEPNKDATSLGIHFKDAKVTVLDETSYEMNGMVTTWLRVRVTEYGCSRDANLGCGKNTPNDADEGWVNAKVVLFN